MIASHTYVDELHPSLVAKVDEVREVFPRWEEFKIPSVGKLDGVPTADI